MEVLDYGLGKWADVGRSAVDVADVVKPPEALSVGWEPRGVDRLCPWEIHRGKQWWW